MIATDADSVKASLSFLQNASQGRLTALTTQLERKEVDINYVDARRGTALSRAAHQGKLEVVRYLLDQGADINLHNADGFTALHCAALADFPLVVTELLNRGANVMSRTRRGTTCLHLAAEYGHHGMARLLLARGADINAADEKGETPLHVAVWSDPVRRAFEGGDQYGTAFLLLALGANAALVENMGFLARDRIPSDSAEIPAFLAASRSYWRPEFHSRLVPRFRANVRPLLMLHLRANAFPSHDGDATSSDASAIGGGEMVLRHFGSLPLELVFLVIESLLAMHMADPTPAEVTAAALDGIDPRRWRGSGPQAGPDPVVADQ